MKVQLLRTYLSDKTVGRILIDGKEVGSSLEDIGRPSGIKIPKETCIPEGKYAATITHSTRFGKPMILLYSDPKTLSCKLDNIEFTGIRVHAGSTTAHTEGCVLTSQEPAIKAAIASAIAKGEPVEWEIARA